MNLVLSGAVLLSGSFGAFGVGDKTATQPEFERTAVVEPILTTPSELVTADPDAEISFARDIVTSKQAPKPKIGVASFDPKAQSSTNFNVEATIAAATKEIGLSFPTGWNMPGECLVAAKRWITAGGGNWYGAGTPIGNYAGATEVEYKNAAPGDVIQYLSPESPASWVNGVHTVLVVANNRDGTLHIIEANNPGGSGFVSETKSWKPAPPQGVIAKVFRF